jgi:ubiquinone/menaquinone biosynthesis C-methylase UbiE
MSEPAGLSFDRAVEFYDASRGLPGDVAQHVMWAIVSLAQATRATRFVEIGVGTGRIALPLIAWGQRVVGLDLSSAMMQRLRANLPAGAAAGLAQADAARLPLADASADAVIMVHVLHVVAGWRDALAETRRILAPRGVLLHSWNRHDENDPTMRVRNRWRDLVAQRCGRPAQRPGAASPDEVVAALQAMGATVTQVTAAEWTNAESIDGEIAAIAARQYSDTWDVSDADLQATVTELTAWAQAEFGDLRPAYPERRRVVFDMARWA